MIMAYRREMIMMRYDYGDLVLIFLTKTRRELVEKYSVSILIYQC